MKLNHVAGAGVLFVLFVYLPLTLLPATVAWYNPVVVLFSDTTVGTPPALSFYREIKRDSMIEYSVVVRNADGEVICDSRGGPFQYKKQEGAVVNKTLTDWAPQDPRCAHLPEGAFRVETTWRVVRPLGDFLPPGILREMFGGVLPPKYVTRVSPVFHVLPPEPKGAGDES